MSYVVLARRYRPQKFAELVGQEHVTQTLKNAILQKRTAHAYLFTGPRGVGKTSAARILAKALRCLNLEPDGEPCNACMACVQVQEGTSMDVIEIDAASNTGVDNIRNLRENVEYMATIGKYRVYIIDEVHMLSTAAFNALLKTLEEPPPHVVFIFATTELHKVLPTIQSRCQRFDFKRIPPGIMSDKLKEICVAEKIAIDDASIKTLVIESEGCMRDAESLLDQAIALCGNNIEINVLERCLSLLDRASFLALLRAIGEHSPGDALKICSDMNDKGVDSKVLLSRTVDFFSDLHFMAFTGQARGSDPDLNQVSQELVKKLSKDEIIRAVDLGIKTQTQLIAAINTSQAVESFIVKVCLTRPAMNVDSTQVSRGTGAPGAGPTAISVSRTSQSAHTASAVGQQAQPSDRPTAAGSRPPHPQSYNPSRSSTSQNPASSSMGGAMGRPTAGKPRPTDDAVAPPTPLLPSEMPRSAPSQTGTGPLEAYIQKQKPSWTAVLQSVLEVKPEEGGIYIKAKADFAGRRLASKDGLDVLKAAYAVKNARVELDQAAVPATRFVDPKEKNRQKQTQAKEHEAVKAAIKIFDATIRDTKILDDDHPSPNTMMVDASKLND